MTESLFEGDTSPSLNEGLVSLLEAGYCAYVLANPPTPAFFEGNPKRKSFARYVTKKDVARFLAVLGDLGLTICPKEERLSSPG